MVMTSIALILSFKKLNDMSGGLLLPPVAAAAFAFAVYTLTRPAPSVSLLGRRVLITGAANGIGKALAELAVERGAAVDLWDADGAGVERLRNQLSQVSPSSTITARLVDVADDASWNAALASLSTTSKGPDVFIASAGVVGGGPITDLPSTISRTLSVNVGGSARVLAAGFAAGGAAENPPVTIVLLGSLMGWLGAKGLADYCASKWAVNGLADCARLEVNAGAGGGKGRTGVHLICPYIVDTSLFAGAFGAPPPEANFLAKLIARLLSAVLPHLSPSRVAKSILDGVALNTGKHRTSFLPWTTRFLAQVPRLVFFAKLAWFDKLLEVSGGRWGMDGWTGGKSGGVGIGAQTVAAAVASIEIKGEVKSSALKQPRASSSAKGATTSTRVKGSPSPRSASSSRS